MSWQKSEAGSPNWCHLKSEQANDSPRYLSSLVTAHAVQSKRYHYQIKGIYRKYSFKSILWKWGHFIQMLRCEAGFGKGRLTQKNIGKMLPNWHREDGWYLDHQIFTTAFDNELKLYQNTNSYIFYIFLYFFKQIKYIDTNRIHFDEKADSIHKNNIHLNNKTHHFFTLDGLCTISTSWP